jgi:hypothetical protein
MLCGIAALSSVARVGLGAFFANLVGPSERPRFRLVSRSVLICGGLVADS